jgi:hypothetical protein
VIFDEASVAPLVERVLPDVLVKAAQYTVDEVVGHEIVQAHGGQIVLAPMKSSYSTSRLIQKITDLARDGTSGGDQPHDLPRATRPPLSDTEGPREAAA